MEGAAHRRSDGSAGTDCDEPSPGLKPGPAYEERSDLSISEGRAGKSGTTGLGSAT